MPSILIPGGLSAHRKPLHHALTAHGYTLHVSDIDNGSLPDLIIFDGEIGHADERLQVIQNVYQLCATPVILLSRYDSDVSDVTSTVPVAAWLTEPFEPQELLGCIRGVLQARSVAPLSEVERLRDSLEHAEQERAYFEEADRKKDEFISFISHELKNPMASIKGYSDLMRRRLNKTPDDPNRKGLEIISAQVGRMTALLDQLLDFSRISMNRLQLDVRPVNLADVAQRVVEEMQPTAEKHAIQLVLGVDTLRLFLDENRIRQALQYLLSNAIKFSLAAGTITVQVEQVDGEGGSFAQVAISDKGIGIPEEDLPHVFERFFRGSNVDEGLAGLGLGLFLANEIVVRHGGYITVASQANQGSTFTVMLPTELPANLE